MADGSIPQVVLPSQSEPVIDRYRRWAPSWWAFIRPLLLRTNDNTVKLAAQASNIDTINAAITLEQSVRADADGALADQITTLTSAYQDADTALNASFTASISSEASTRASADGALSTRIDSVEADYQGADFTLQSNIDNEASTRASADGALSTQINTVETNYQTADTTLAASISSEQTARVAADGVNASDIATVSTTVAGHTTDITTNTTSIGGLQGKWGVTINADKRVTGIELNSGADNTSTFAVMADKFIIVLPTDDTETIQAFIAGLVNGVATVGINGDLVVDQTITADKITTMTLSAIVADLGTITAGLIKDTANTYNIDIPNGIFKSTDNKAVLDLKNKTLVFQP